MCQYVLLSNFVVDKRQSNPPSELPLFRYAPLFQELQQFLHHKSHPLQFLFQLNIYLSKLDDQATLLQHFPYNVLTLLPCKRFPSHDLQVHKTVLLTQDNQFPQHFLQLFLYQTQFFQAVVECLIYEVMLQIYLYFQRYQFLQVQFQVFLLRAYPIFQQDLSQSVLQIELRLLQAVLIQ